MGGLLYLVQGGGTGRAVARPVPPPCTKNVTAHPSPASVQTFMLFDVALKFPVPIEGLTYQEPTRPLNNISRTNTSSRTFSDLERALDIKHSNL